MDLQGSLTHLAKFLIKDKDIAKKVRLQIIRNEDLFTILISSRTKSGPKRGSGTNGNIFIAFIKSILELGEEIIRDDLGLHCRSGLAGGLFSKSIIERGKCELLERDSFFYHYRNRIPFEVGKEIEMGRRTFYVYKLKCSCPDYFTILIKEKEKLFLNQEMVFFTMATSKSINEAIKKCIEEYYSLEVFLDQNTTFLKYLLEGSVNSDNQIVPHLLASFDRRNIERFNELCSLFFDDKKTPGACLDTSWKITSVQSPIKIFKFFRVESSELVKIRFNVQEESDPGLFHPYW